MCVHFLCATSEHAQSILNYTRFHSSEEGGLVLKRRFSALQLYYETQHFIPVVFKHFTERLIFEHLWIFSENMGEHLTVMRQNHFVLCCIRNFIFSVLESRRNNNGSVWIIINMNIVYNVYCCYNKYFNSETFWNDSLLQHNKVVRSFVTGKKLRRKGSSNLLINAPFGSLFYFRTCQTADLNRRHPAYIVHNIGDSILVLHLSCVMAGKLVRDTLVCLGAVSFLENSILESTF